MFSIPTTTGEYVAGRKHRLPNGLRHWGPEQGLDVCQRLDIVCQVLEVACWLCMTFIEFGSKVPCVQAERQKQTDENRRVCATARAHWHAFNGSEYIAEERLFARQTKAVSPYTWFCLSVSVSLLLSHVVFLSRYLFVWCVC